MTHAQESTQADEEEAIEVIDITGTVSRFGATKSNTPIVETARSLSIVTAHDFLERGALNLSQTSTYLLVFRPKHSVLQLAGIGSEFAASRFPVIEILFRSYLAATTPLVLKFTP
jgi:hypothetical protein